MQRRAIFFYSLLFVVITMTNCVSVRTKFSKQELKWIDVYKEGEALIYKSEKGELDTTLILKKEIIYPEYNPVEVHDKYLPQWGIVWYKNKNLGNHPEGDKLITMFKKHPKNNTYLNINYLYSSITILNLTTGSTAKYKHGKIYEFDTYRSKAKPNEPKKIFWHEDYGVIKYITHDDVVWERINLPQ